MALSDGRAPDAPPPRLIDTVADWHAAAPAVSAASRIALDTEADGFHRYPERVSLLQIGLPDGTILIVDPLAVADLDALGKVLADRSIGKVVHSADYDIRSLDRDYRFRLAGLFDTAIAAQFCGSSRTGLANVLIEYGDVAVTKSKQLQRLDWSRRPLAEDALAYAADDVVYLLPLADHLSGRLAELGRTEWVAEECRRLEGVRYHVPDPPETAFLAVTGARDLTDAGRAVLRELYVWRDAEARRMGRPPHMVLPAPTMLTLADAPDGDLDQLARVNRQWLATARASLLAALARGRAAEPVRWPRRPRGEEWTRETNARLRRLKEWRAGQAALLALDTGVVWPVDHLKQVALRPNAASRGLDHGSPPWVRDWQWGALGEAFERYRREGLADQPLV